MSPARTRFFDTSIVFAPQKILQTKVHRSSCYAISDFTRIGESLWNQLRNAGRDTNPIGRRQGQANNEDEIRPSAGASASGRIWMPFPLNLAIFTDLRGTYRHYRMDCSTTTRLASGKLQPRPA